MDASEPTLSPQKPRPISSWLVNVLASVFIVAVLVAILSPPRGKLRESARRSSCSSNLKQIGLSMRQYMQDNDDHFPQRTSGTKANGEVISWRNALSPYTKSVDL